MRAEPLVEATVRALGHQVDVHLAQDRREAVGVVELLLGLAVGDPQAVGEGFLTPPDRACEETGVVHLLELGSDPSRLAVGNLYGACPRHKGAHGQRHVAPAVHAEHLERIAMRAAHHRFDFRRIR